jgi:imidazolonepropionase-like amidohydrolase
MSARKRSRPARGADAIVIRNVRVYPSPSAAPIDDASIVVGGGRIRAIGHRVPVPNGAEPLRNPGTVVTAGFWNSHVHFTEPKWANSAAAAPSTLGAQLREMLTRRGFSTVVDTGSDLRTTTALRARVDSGEVPGPSILTAGSSIFPPNGIPFYVREGVPPEILPFIPQPASPAAARQTVEAMIDHGADLIKIFTGSWVRRGEVLNMPPAIARAATRAAHARGRLVFSHASNLAGVRIAIRAGVDVLAHPPDATRGVGDAMLRELVAHRTSMIPTLKMFATQSAHDTAYLEPIDEVVRRFRALGGVLLFGTDVGFMTDYDTAEEFRALVRCGLDGRAILRSLTTAPARRFGVDRDVGTVAVGRRADLVLLESDPVEDPTAFARVTATIRAGRVVYSSRDRPRPSRSEVGVPRPSR